MSGAVPPLLIYSFMALIETALHSNKSNQPDASIYQIYCSSFEYSSTCFGRPHAHHQELINCSSLPLERGGNSVVGRGRSEKKDSIAFTFVLLSV